MQLIVEIVTGKVVEFGLVDASQSDCYDPDVHEIVDGEDLNGRGFDLHYPIYRTGTNEYVQDSVTVAKAKRTALVDFRTRKFVTQEFEFDDHTFSLSERAQHNLLVLQINKSTLSWPQELSTKDDQIYSLAESDVDAFVAAGLNKVNERLAAGRAIREAINACTTQEELDAVIDSRS